VKKFWLVTIICLNGILFSGSESFAASRRQQIKAQFETDRDKQKTDGQRAIIETQIKAIDPMLRGNVWVDQVDTVEGPLGEFLRLVLSTYTTFFSDDGWGTKSPFRGAVEASLLQQADSGSHERLRSDPLVLNLLDAIEKDCP
jgi:hypothetical protein